MIRWLYGLQHFGIKLGLENIRTLLDAFGRPERAYPSVLVGGTNGKGSVAAILASILEASGVTTGLYTSPHLVRPNERIRIGGSDIGDAELEARLAAVRETIEALLASGRLAAHPSFFEVVTAAALLAFADHRVGAAVLEVGLGGRLDATNEVDADLAVLVGVDLDHTSVLGNTIAQIAAEKAAIVKPGRPVVSGLTRQVAIDVLQRTCTERGARFVDARSEVLLAEEQGEEFTLRSARQRYPGLRLSLAGRHQLDNARIALAAFELYAERLGIEPDPEAVRRGLAAVRWPGRLQWLEASADRPRMLLDGAHNAPGMATLARYVTALPSRPAVVLVAATEGRPIRELLEPLGRVADRIVVTRAPVGKAIPVAALVAAARGMFSHVEALDDVGAALERASELATPGGFIVVTGSLYLVGGVLARVAGANAPGPVSM